MMISGIFLSSDVLLKILHGVCILWANQALTGKTVSMFSVSFLAGSSTTTFQLLRLPHQISENIKLPSGY
jgi:hypothetical protein